ncbi:MAG: glycosyltransferase family 2 protein [Arhodomonas sp.]|nr:glycosyltransferase family 2 protein [Arhodomonas sp.]
MLRQPRAWRWYLGRARRRLADQGLRGTLIHLLQGPAGATGHGDYASWFERYGRPDEEERARIAKAVAAMPAPPLISVLMPTYNTDPALLGETVDSVRDQLYPHWELCIADDASTSTATRHALEALSAEDQRIRVAFREDNGHIAAASNTALAMAQGEYLALLDHDDLLTEDALFHVAETARAHPEAVLFYSDEDKVGEGGQLYDPYFKPEWNPDLLRSQNYINHLTTYRTDAVRAAGGFREGFEGSQDYDLLLRVIDVAEPGAVRHIPRILYHWRAVAGSEALEAGVKDYTRDAAQRALSEHLQRRGKAAAVLPAPECPGMWRIRYALPERPPRASLIMPTRNGLELITRSLETVLHRTDYPDYEILVVDNGSDDPAVLGYLEELEASGRVRVLRDGRPFNFSALNNAAAAEATGSVLVLLNNDVEVTDGDWLRELVSHAIRPEIGCVGARLWYPDDTLQHGGCVLGIGGVAGHVFKDTPRGTLRAFGRNALIQNYSAVTAACLAVRKRVFEQAGGLDEDRLAVAFNDIDFCLKVRGLGYRNLWTPYAELYHHESASRGYEDTPEKQQRFAGEINAMLERWGDLLRDDPAYNPNLTLDGLDLSLAWPPRRGHSG